MLPRKLYTILLSLTLCLLSVLKAPAQVALAGEQLLFSTRDDQPHADTALVFTVSDFEIEGNKKTREKIIMRELPFEEGARYTLAELVERCRGAQARLMNTGLFLDVTVGIAGTSGNEARILVSVKERWYFFPVPFVDVTGISYQKWISDGMPLANVKYGLKLKHKNLSGLNDKLSFNITNGYMKELSLNYDGLPLDYQLKWALNFSFQMGQQRDIAYRTDFNKVVGMHDDNRFLYRYTHIYTSATWRPAIKTRHQFGMAWHDESFADTIGQLNKSYLNEENRVQYPEFFYNLSYQDLDFIPYPTHGLAAEASITKKGFRAPINLWQVSARASWYHPLTPRSFINLRATGLLKLPFKQPYTMQQFVGYNEMFLQGYESYTIDGVAGGFAKASIHRRVLDHKFGMHIKKLPQLSSIPVKIYVKAFANAGYIYNEQPGNNYLNNTLLASAGVGLDVVLFYDFTFHLEWSVNGNSGNGLYLSNRNHW
jgi:outer membrane protein assembly factor BamA